MIDTLVHSAYSHLIESTLFAAAAALLTLAFRANRAPVRFWLWLSASLKFLIPFAFLSLAGGHISTLVRAPSLQATGAAAPTLSYTGSGIDHLSPEPLTGLSSPAGAPPIDRAALYKVMTSVWLCGVGCVALIRLRGAWRIRLLIRASLCTDIGAPVEVRASPGLVEPGVVGWIRPLLLLPLGITERLAPAEMDAILAHELCHVRRRDNLLALIHMIVEAIFWFHPLVWWIGARLIEEREYACDEDVVSCGNAPDLYAEAIVKVCKWSTESPLACVSGITGGTLKRRIERIINLQDKAGLSFAKKAALTVAGAAVLMVPIVVGAANAPAILAQSTSGVPEWQAAAGGKMSFEVASVKLMQPGSRPPMPTFPLDSGDMFASPRTGERPNGRFTATFPLTVFISFAYKLTPTPDQAEAMRARLPKWVETDDFEINAKAAGNPTKDQMRLMMQSLLTDRFHLAAHFETREVSMFALTLIKPGTFGPNLIRHADGPPCGTSVPSTTSVAGSADAEVFPRVCEVLALIMRNGRMVSGSRNTTMALLAASLSGNAGRPVIDRTGITDRIDYRLEWTPEANGPGIAGEEIQTDPRPFTWMEALRHQLGPKLESTKGPIQTLVIDHVERPSEN